MRASLLFEFLVIFVLLPLAYRFGPLRFPVLPLLWAATGYSLWRLLRDPAFDRGKLWNPSAAGPHLAPILLGFGAGALILWWAVHWFAPELAWSFPRQHPAFWAVVMVAYPVLSVYPQAVIYRAFFFERYSRLFHGEWWMILASAAAFGFMHLIFRNWIAVGLTFAGGVLFAWRYAETGSLFTSSFEHALYGCWLFTLGLGQFFYHGAIRSAGSLLQK